MNNNVMNAINQGKQTRQKANNGQVPGKKPAQKKEFKLDKDYVFVAERVVEFRNQYPNGSIRVEDDPVVHIIGEEAFVQVKAKVFREKDDPIPAGIGCAWEPIPGPTPYTKDSELQNAETAAIGRALIWALAVDAKKGIASFEEVLARKGLKEFGGVEEARAMVKAAGDDVNKLRDFYRKAQTRGADPVALSVLAEAGENLAKGES